MINELRSSVIRQTVDHTFGDRLGDPDIKKLLDIINYLICTHPACLPKQEQTLEMIEQRIKEIIESSV